MKPRHKVIAISSVLVCAALGAGLASAQVPPRPNFIPAAAPTTTADFKLLNTDKGVYRYDTKSGRTELLSLNPTGGAWVGMLDVAAPPVAGDAGRYEIVEGPTEAGRLIRLDKKTGRTWKLVVTGAANWQEATKQ